MKTRYEMTKLFSVEKDFGGGIKVIAGDMTKTYNNLPISTVSFLFGLSHTSVGVQVGRIEFTFAFAMKGSDKTFDAIIRDIAVGKLIDVIK